MAAAASQQWFYSQNGQKFGPVDAAMLRQLAQTRRLQPADLVWREGMAEWSPGSRVKGLFPETVVAVTPPPLPASSAPPPAVSEANLDERYNSIYCSKDERIVFGLCGGLAHKFGAPVAAIRFMVFLSLFVFIGWFYFVGLFLPKLPTKGVLRPN
jgi:phage shock protein PspC (stress-responsive transcriptional regulator)